MFAEAVLDGRIGQGRFLRPARWLLQQKYAALPFDFSEILVIDSSDFYTGFIYSYSALIFLPKQATVLFNVTKFSADEGDPHNF